MIFVHGTTTYATNNAIRKELSKCKIQRDRIRNRMSNVRVQQIITLLYLSKRIITSKGVMKHQAYILNEYFDRIGECGTLFDKNPLISSTFQFMKIVIDTWYN